MSETVPTMSEKERKREELKRQREANQKAKEEVKRQKLLAKEQLLKEREARQKEKDFEKNKKKAERDIRRGEKPGTCQKLLSLMIDPKVLNCPCGGPLLDTLQKEDLKYEIQTQALENIITIWREVTKVEEGKDQTIAIKKSEEVEDQIMLVLPLDEFIAFVHASTQAQAGCLSSSEKTLTDHVREIRTCLENRKVTLIVQGLEQYYKNQYNSMQRQHRKQILGEEAKTKRAREIFQSPVKRADVELQLQTETNIIFTESNEETVATIMRFIKAVAEAPFKKDRQVTGFSFHIESVGTVRIDQKGQGVTQAWRQQLQQFKMVTVQVANAIVSEYPTPMALYQAYQKCATPAEAELLLQNILVRRGAGVMETARRVGKELSRRVYELYNQENPNFIIS